MAESEDKDKQANPTPAEDKEKPAEAATAPPEDESPDHKLIRAALNLADQAGFQTVLIDMQYKKGAKLGLIIRNYEKKVMVSKLEPSSLGAEKLMVGDVITAVNTDLATEREMTKNLILKSFVKKRKVTLVVRRPVSSEAKLWAKTAILSASTRTSSTAPREKQKWARMAAQQRQAAKLFHQPGGESAKDGKATSPGGQPSARSDLSVTAKGTPGLGGAPGNSYMGPATGNAPPT
uniref:PDZ domain-containing protein n=1 Tax=Panagrellus redivivus TaxID=6233 RepID=A0A7E4VBE6_PANRE